MSAIKNVMKNNYRNLELNEFLSAHLVMLDTEGWMFKKLPSVHG